jgi:hypothetical protein
MFIPQVESPSAATDPKARQIEIVLAAADEVNAARLQISCVRFAADPA